MSVRRSGPLVLAAVLTAAACNKTVSQRAPAPIVLATFDPGEPGVRAATIPLPSDLALQAAPAQTGLTREVLFSYITGDGFPGDQTIAVPIRSESFHADTGQYAPDAAPPAGIDATTVNAQTVAIVKIDDPALPVFRPQLAAYGVDPANPASGILRIRSVTGLPVGRYVVAVRGGDQGVKTADGLPIGPDQAIALIAPNKDLTQPENQPPVPLTPEQIAALEQLRALFAHGLDWGRVSPSAVCHAADPQLPATIPEDECWLPPAAPSAGVTAPFQAIDKVFPHHQLASIQTFEVSAPAVVADTSAGVLPFPSDFLLGANGKVRNVPSFGAAALGLAQLDGFSTTSLDLVPVSAPIDPATVAGNVHVYELGAGAPRQLVPVGATGTPEYLLLPTPDQTTPATFIGVQPAVPIPNGDSIVPLPPLKPKTRYLVVVTDGVKDPQGRALVPGTLGRLLLTLSTPLVTDGHSNIPGVSDADAAGLQALRDALRNQLLPAVSGTLGGKQPVMAYTITTQDVKTTSAGLTALPYGHAEFAATSEVADFDPTPALPLDVPFTHVKRFLSAKVSSVDVLDPTTGALDPTLATWTTQFQDNKHDLPVLVAVPKLGAECTPATPCAKPLVVFHHGIFGSRFQMLGVADALAAKGFVVVATDAPFHGDRAFCKQNSECNGGTCRLDPANQRAPGTCQGGNGLAYNPTRLSTYASGNYFISPNFFRLRDALREDLVDQSALVLAAAPPPGGPANALATALVADGVAVNPLEIYFAGASLGGMIGTSAVATNPRISRVALTVAGGTMVDVFTQAPAFGADIATLFAQLIPGFTPDKVTPGSATYDPVVAQQYAQTLILAKWILDPVEPVNWAGDVTTKTAASSALTTALGGLAVPGADAYGQLIQGDPVVPNPFNLLLYQQNGDIRTTLYTTTMDVGSRHGILILPGTAGDVVRGDLANFLLDGTVPATPVVALPLP